MIPIEQEVGGLRTDPIVADKDPDAG